MRECMNQKADLLFLNENQTIAAGAGDIRSCIKTMKDVFSLMYAGDYVMGGKNFNSHGQEMVFPESGNFANMPKNGPDRRFMAMMAYVGGRFNVAGEKWYGSNRGNLAVGLPRSIHTVVLNDVNSSMPLAIVAATKISAVRTGAVAGLAAEYLARPDSKILALIGAGAIGTSCCEGILETCKNIEEIRICTVTPTNALKLQADLKQSHPGIKTTLTTSIEAAVRGADIVNSATSGAQLPLIRAEWLKDGVYCSMPAGLKMDDALLDASFTKFADNWKMYEAWAEELPRPFEKTMPMLGMYFFEAVEKGALPRAMITDFCQVVGGAVPGRRSSSEKILLAMGGQCVYDVAWAFEVYQKALAQGIGTTLNYWDQE